MKKFIVASVLIMVTATGFSGRGSAATLTPGPKVMTITTVTQNKLSEVDCASLRKALPNDDCTFTVTTTVTGTMHLTPVGMATTSQTPDKCVPGVSYYATYKQQIAHWPAYSVTQRAQIGDDPCNGVAWVNDSSHHCVKDYSVGYIISMDFCYSVAGNGWAEAYMGYSIQYGVASFSFHGAIVVSSNGIYSMST